MTLALAVLPSYATDLSSSVSLQELLAAPKDPANIRAYLKRVLIDYWKTRLALGTDRASAVADSWTMVGPTQDHLIIREKWLERSIRELLRILIRNEGDKQTLKRWAQKEHVIIPWTLAPRRIGAAA